MISSDFGTANLTNNFKTVGKDPKSVTIHILLDIVNYYATLAVFRTLRINYAKLACKFWNLESGSRINYKNQGKINKQMFVSRTCSMSPTSDAKNKGTVGAKMLNTRL